MSIIMDVTKRKAVRHLFYAGFYASLQSAIWLLAPIESWLYKTRIPHAYNRG